MPQKRTKTASTGPTARRKRAGSAAKLIGDARQLLQPPEFRIREEVQQGQPKARPLEPVPSPTPAQSATMPTRLICEMANCLWHVKTRHFPAQMDG